jgi:hypothetical protein
MAAIMIPATSTEGQRRRPARTRPQLPYVSSRGQVRRPPMFQQPDRHAPLD